MIRENDEECLLLIETIRARSNTIGGLYGTNSEVVRLMGNLETRIEEKVESEYQEKEKALVTAVAQAKEQEKVEDVHKAALEAQDWRRKTFEADIQEENDRVSDRSFRFSEAIHSEVVREVGERLNPVCKVLTQIEQNIHNLRAEFTTELAEARIPNESLGVYRAELVKAALRILDYGRVDSKLHETATAFLLKALGNDR